jgi:hypothetical protein
VNFPVVVPPEDGGAGVGAGVESSLLPPQDISTAAVKASVGIIFLNIVHFY